MRPLKLGFGKNSFCFFTKSTTPALPTISTCWQSMAVFIVLADQISSPLRLFHAVPNPSAAVSLANFIKGASKNYYFFIFCVTTVGRFPNFPKLPWQLQTRKCFHLRHLRTNNLKKKNLNFSPIVYNLEVVKIELKN